MATTFQSNTLGHQVTLAALSRTTLLNTMHTQPTPPGPTVRKLNSYEAKKLYVFIKANSPNIPAHFLYAKDDLVSQVYLEANRLGLGPDDHQAVRKLIHNFAISQYRPKYATHRTANYSAEELQEFCAGRVVLPEEKVISPLAEGIFVDLREAFMRLEETSLTFANVIKHFGKP